MNRQMWIPALGVLVGVLALAAGKNGMEENGFTLPGYHNADAKFLGEHIITSMDEGIQILDMEGNVARQYEGLNASWLYVQEEDAGPEERGAAWTVACSNHANETHILRLADEGELLEDRRPVPVLTFDHFGPRSYKEGRRLVSDAHLHRRHHQQSGPPGGKRNLHGEAVPVGRSGAVGPCDGYHQPEAECGGR